MKLYIVINELSNKAISQIIQAENDGMALLGFKSFMESGELKKVGIQPEIVTIYQIGEILDESHELIPVAGGPCCIANGVNYQEKLDEFIKSLKLSEQED